jgi:hypothetical protein
MAISDYIFISLRGTNELVVENLTIPGALDELQRELFPLWPPGIESHETRGDVWRVRFMRGPWSSKGRDGLL